MKKIFLFAAIAAFFTSLAMAQEPDLAMIAKMREIKADSLSLMLGKVYGTQTAMSNPTAEARQTLLNAFNEAVNLEQKDENYQEGATAAEQFFRNAEGVKRQLGITLSRKIFAQTFLTRFADTTTVKDMNSEMRNINMEAKRLMGELGELKKDSLANVSIINLKSDSLSQNMGLFFGTQMQNVIKKKNLSDEQSTQFLEGFNSLINIDESNKPLIDGKLLASDFKNFEKNIKKQMNLKLNKEAFVNALTNELKDPKVPTMDDFKAIDNKTQAYMKETQAFVKENSPEALTQKGLGKKYIENQMEKDPNFIQAPSGLVYKILNPGNGKKFKETDKIKVMYKGTHVDGKTFDESKEPVSFAPGQVVPGFKEALLMMSPGAKMIAILPYNLAYGDRGAGGSIKPFETLVFEIETLGIDDSAPATQPAQQATGKPAQQATAKPGQQSATKQAAKTPTVKEEKTTTGNNKKSSGKKSSGKKTSKKRK